MHPLQDWPLPLLAIVLMAILGAALHIGTLAGRRIYRGRARASREGLGYIVSTSLALLGLLLGFTFGASQDRFNVRRRLVAEEANALLSTYMFVRSRDDAASSELAPLILQYGQTREAFFEARTRQAEAQAEAVSERLQDLIWARALDTTRDGAGYTILDRVRQLFEVDGTRRAEHDARVPLGIVQLLAVFAIIATAVIGLSLTGRTRHVVASTALLLLLTTTACLILGLDRQRSPVLLASQAPMEHSLAAIQRWENARLAGRGPPSSLERPGR